MKETAIIILAAGASSRLGRPKQLLPLGGQLLIQRMVDAAVEAGTGKVFVVTGAYGEEVRQALSRTAATVIHNEHWAEGMASSIRVGVGSVSCETEGVVLCVCDQPLVSAELFVRIVEAAAETGKGIIACSYADTIGVPVLFHSRYFYSLAQLHASEGAKGLIFRFPDDVAVVPFPGGEKDIDTEEDYTGLLQ